MRKLVLILAVLVVVPVAVFAQWGAGGAVFFKSPVLLGQSISLDDLNVDQVCFGGDVRLKLSLFQAEALVLYAAGDVDSLHAFVDAGLAFDIAILRLSLGAGPNFTYNLGETTPPVQAGFNAKISADLVFGSISVGLSYIMALTVEGGIAVDKSTGLLGFNVLFWGS